MSKENQVISALVKLTLCPGSIDASEHCKMCSYRSNSIRCARMLKQDCMNVLSLYDAGMHNAAECETTLHDSEQRAYEADNVISAVLRDVGVPTHIRGYEYIKEAIYVILNDASTAHCITKVLYPSVAEKFNTTGSRVERAIRHAVESACDRCDYEVLFRYFGNTVSQFKGKPTNAEFITAIAGYVRHKLV